jgi:acetyl-CoA/propionyl-CoA carboxylase carboxyl transferase subunit
MEPHPPSADGQPQAAGGDHRSARARLYALLDPGTCELITPSGDEGVTAANGRIGDTLVVAFATDRGVQGGAMGEVGCQVVVTAYEKALANECPIIGLWHSGGARLGEGVASLHGVGQVFARMTRASGRIPQISVVLGPAAGGAAYGAALTDVVILAPDGLMFVTGPDVIRSSTGEQVDAQSLGGTTAHDRSGVVHLYADSEQAAFGHARRLVGLLAEHGRIDPATVEARDLGSLLPASPTRAYDVRPLVNAVLDRPGIELHAMWARNIVTTLGRIGGRSIGVVANNPLRLAGCLDSASAEKAARFVRMCDAFGLPLIVLVDTPGYLPGAAQEWSGVVRRGAKLLHAFAEAVVPRVSLVTRKAYGGGYIAMNSQSLGATTVYAWPAAEVAVMGGVAAVRILHRRRLAGTPPDQRTALEQELAAEYQTSMGGLELAMAVGAVNRIIEPANTRGEFAAALGGLAPVRGLHNNIPL